MLLDVRILVLVFLYAVEQCQGVPTDDDVTLDQSVIPVSSSYNNLIENLPSTYNHVTELQQNETGSKREHKKGKNTIKIVYKRRWRNRTTEQPTNDVDDARDETVYGGHSTSHSTQSSSSIHKSNVRSKTMKTHNYQNYDDDIISDQNLNDIQKLLKNDDNNLKTFSDLSTNDDYIKTDQDLIKNDGNVYNDHSLDNNNEGLTESSGFIENNHGNNLETNAEDMVEIDRNLDDNSYAGKIDANDINHQGKFIFEQQTVGENERGEGRFENIFDQKNNILAVPEYFATKANERTDQSNYEMAPVNIDDYMYQQHTHLHPKGLARDPKLLLRKICKLGWSIVKQLIRYPSKIRRVIKTLKKISNILVDLKKQTTDIQYELRTEDYNTDYDTVADDIHKENDVDNNNKDNEFDADNRENNFKNDNEEYDSYYDKGFYNEGDNYSDYNQPESEADEASFESDDNQNDSTPSFDGASDDKNGHFGGYQVIEPDNIEVVAMTINDIIKILRQIPKKKRNSYVIEFRSQGMQKDLTKRYLGKLYSDKKFNGRNQFRNQPAIKYSTLRLRQSNVNLPGINYFKRARKLIGFFKGNRFSNQYHF